MRNKWKEVGERANTWWIKCFQHHPHFSGKHSNPWGSPHNENWMLLRLNMMQDKGDAQGLSRAGSSSHPWPTTPSPPPRWQTELPAASTARLRKEPRALMSVSPLVAAKQKNKKKNSRCNSEQKNIGDKIRDTESARAVWLKSQFASH